MNAIQQLLTEHIDIWTGAEVGKRSGRGRSSGNGVSVYGIKKLRELILELAVRGKLVPQDANDEPASELLKRIQAEKSKLIAEGKVKKDKSFAPITEGEKPFALPNGWEWVRIGNVGHDWGQKTPDSDFTYIEVSAIDSQRGIVASAELLKPENAPSRARKVVKQGTVIYSTVRPYLLNIAVIDEEFLPEPIASTAFAIVHPYCSMPPRYLLCFFRSPVFVRYVESVQMGIAYPAINDGQFFSGFIPLPPLAEQHRIVAKVDELMALCDQLEAQQNNAAQAHEKLVSHLLGTLTQSQNAEDFSANWQRIAVHFDTLFTTEASIDALKQTLLQLAVMGKLVPQDVNDEPASKLLKRIQAEKAKLIAEGKLKKEKLLAPISEDEKPFELPNGWEWIRLGSLGDWGAGATPLRSISSYYGGDMPWFKSGELSSDFIDVAEETITEQALKECSLRLNQPGDVLIAMYGATIGKASILKIPATTNQAVCACTPNGSIFNRYLLVLLKAMKSNFIGQGAGGAQPNISREKIIATTAALPPLSEQHRIVAKVDELMALCDQLKTRIQQAGQQQQLLADVLVARAVA
jgi:type I restriction enzyme S subunit